MPYRRLPNTDISRIKALKIAIEKASSVDFREIAISMRLFSEAKSIVVKFEELNYNYQEKFDTQVKSNIIFQSKVKNARMYISHFIQVLYLSIIRSEIKKEQLEYYGLDKLNLVLPELNSNDQILEWGEKVIQGEKKRIQIGGVPIYNPTIAKVNVMYSLFKEGYQIQKIHQRATNRISEDIADMRAVVDRIILNIWDEVERYNTKYMNDEKIERNKEYGIIYYYRSGEKILNEND